MFYPYGDTKTVVPDIFRRVHLDKYFQNRLHLQEYYISDQESPEIVADKFYGSSKYHWLVIIANNIVDVKREWPLSNNSLVAYCDEKYGEGNRTAVHHYVMTEDKTVIVDWDATLVANGSYQAVTNLEYETGLNDAKRQILLLHKQFLRDITAQYLRLVK